MADLFTLMLSNSLEDNGPAGVAAACTLDNKINSDSVSIYVPVHGISLQDAATVTSIPPPQVTPIQPMIFQSDQITHCTP
jgi:hypothetical protein